MGLDVSHGCWRGAYSAFSAWRHKLAEVAGMPDLDKFAGYMQGTTFDTPSGAFGLPLSWEPYGNDALTVLLRHGDSAGIIPLEWCEPLAKRLEELIAAAPDKYYDGHLGSWHAKTQTFIEGLRLAASLGENVEFH